MRLQPLGDLERDADLEAVAGQREREQPLGALEAVQDRVAVGVQGPGGACGAELLADVHAQRVAQLAVGAGQLAERPRDELTGALLVLQGQRDELDIGDNNPPAPSSTVYVPIPAYAPVYVTDNQAVVQQYYADLNSHDYASAWALGGNNLNGYSGYDAWVAGYSTTSWVTLGTWEYYPGSNAIQVTITAGQSDGSVRTYQGSYTVYNGVITSASIVQTS